MQAKLDLPAILTSILKVQSSLILLLAQVATVKLKFFQACFHC